MPLSRGSLYFYRTQKRQIPKLIYHASVLLSFHPNLFVEREYEQILLFEKQRVNATEEAL